MERRVVTLSLAVLLAGCAAAAERTEPLAVPGERSGPVAMTAERSGPVAVREQVHPLEEPAVVPTDAPPAPRTEPVPPPRPATGEAPAALVARMRADLEQRLANAGVEGTPAVVSSEEVEWADGGMGCGRPGEMHTMMIIPGYRVVFGVGARRYAYHASRAGAFKYCDSPLRLPPPSAGRENPTT